MATTDRRKLQLETEVNAEGAREGFAAVEAAGDKMAAGVAKSAERAGRSVDGIGNGADAAAGKVDTATRSLVGSIQRTTAAMEAGSKSSGDYYRALASQRGVDVNTLKPYLDQLDAVSAKQRAATAAMGGSAESLEKVGMSAKATAAAMRNVPAQFTDIVVSLQAGQAPLTVLLQQGGQLKDMFGGIGGAAKALGGYALGLINPFTLVAAAVGATALAYYQGSKEADAYEKSLILTGNSAGTTSSKLQSMAVGISAIVGTQGAAAEALAAMAGTGQVAAQSLEQFSAVAIRMERDVGISVADTVKNFAELGKGPVEASLKLNDSMHYLSAATYEQIKALKDMGRESEAAALAQKTYGDALETVARRMSGTQGSIERGWTAVKDAAKSAWDAMLGVGRAETIVGQLAKAQTALQERQANGPLNANTSASWEKGNALLKERIAYLSESVRMEGRGASAAAERVRIEEAGIGWAKEGEKYLTKSEKMNAAITRITVQGLAAGKSMAEIQARIASEREKDGTKAKAISTSEMDSLRARLTGAKQYLDLLKEQGLKADKLNEGDKLVLKLQEELRGKLDAKTRSMKESELVVAREYAAILKGTDAYTDRLKLVKELDKEQGKIVDEAMKAAVTVTAHADAQAAANATFGLGKSALAELTLAQMEKSRADLEATDNVIPGYIQALDAQISAQKRYVSELKAGEGLAAGKKAAEESAKAAKDAFEEWQKSAEKIGDTITDALMRGFESGKGFAQALRDTVVNMFKTLVLRPVISAIVNPVASAITGGLGLASTGASAASGAGGVSDMLGLGKMAASIGGTFAEFGTTLLASTQTAIGMTATAAQASSAAIMGAAAQTGSLIGSLGPLITAAPYIAAIAGVYLLAKKLDHSGTLHTGAGSGYSASGGLQSAAGGDIFDGGFTGIKYSDQTAQMTDGIVKGIVDILDSTAVTFGQTAGHAAATSFADDTSKDGAWGSLVITQLGQVMTDWAASAGSNKREFSDGSAGTQEYLAAISADVRTALDGIGLPAWATAMLDELGNAPSLEQLSATAQAINTTQAALVQMGDKLTGFADLSDGAVAALIKAAGGIGALAASASSYYDNFYTDGEKTANTLAGITDALAAVGQTTPATREAFRAQVEYLQSIADTEPAAAPALAALLGVSGAFATIVPATEAASVAAAGSAAGIASLSTALDALRSPIRSIEDVANSIFKLEGEGSALQIELLKTYGDSASMAEASRLQREAETAGMTAQEVALYSLNATRRAEIDAIEAARLATADGVASWENYFSMFGTDAEKQSRAKTRVAAVLAPDIDTAEEYRAAVYLLTEQFGVGSAEVKRVTDVAGDFAIAFPTVAESIAEVAATAVTLDQALATLSASDAARTVEQIAGSMFSLKEQAFQLTNAGNAPALRARTLAGLSSAPDATGATEQSLQQTVWELQDLGDAAKVADAAMKSNTASYAAWSDAMASPDEKKAAATARINALFGSGVDNMDAYRAAVEKLAATYGIGSDQVRLATDAAGDFALAFPAVADAISAVSDTVVTLEQALAALSSSNAARTVDQIAGSMVSLQDKLFGIVNAGDMEALRKKTRAGLSSVQVNGQSELSLQNDVWSAQDAAARAGERAGLQQQLDLLTGVTTARDLERAALNESSRSLFDQVTAAQDAKTASEALAAAEKTAADERTAAANAVATERAGIQQQLDLLTGVTTARAVERAALDETNRALYDQVEAAQAAKTASEALAEAEKSAADDRTAAAKAASDERAGLQQQLDLLTGVTTARDLERASLDETNRALFDQVESAQAAKTAAEELAAAEKVVADERDAAAKAVASERAGLQEQLSLLTGVTTARELERAALDETNRAIYDQVTAAQAAKTASEALAEADKVAAGERDAAAKAVASERAGLQEQLDLLTGITTARDLERAALDETNRALFDQVTAAQSAKTAAEELSAAEKLAADERTAAANAVTSERAGLQQQLDLLAGVTTARDLERAALDETNRALFDQVTAAQAAKDAADQLSASMNGLSAIGASLEIELQRALGNVDLADAMQQAIDTAGMTEAEIALYDYNQALRDQIEAANAASDAAAQAQAAADAAANEAADALQRIADAASAAAQQIAQERDGLARQLLQLQGDTAALRALDLAAIDPANRALQEHIWALEDEKTAAEQAAAASKAIADERIGLEQQLMQLQGDTAGLRALELAALDPSNRALQEQVWALEDLQSATEATTTAWESLTDSLMKEVDRIRGVMAESSTDSTAALQSRFAIATAQARAGDQDAAGNLAGYSSALLAAAADDAGSRIELIRLQAQIAASLQATADLMGAGPGATATLQGASLQQVVAVASNTQAPANEKLEALVVQLTAEITDLKRQMSSIQQNTRRTADAVNGAGEAPMLVEVDA